MGFPSTTVVFQKRADDLRRPVLQLASLDLRRPAFGVADCG